MRIAYFTLIILLTQSCRPNIQDLKQKYPAEVINYFYETAFWIDYVGKGDMLSVWKKDINIYMKGEFYPDDIVNMKNVIAQLDSLKLPINIQLTPDSSKANMFVYFGDYVYLKSMGIDDSIQSAGKVTISINDGYIESAIIGIDNNSYCYKKISKEDSVIFRHSILMEEVVQSLGISGDSWHYTSSLFFEGKYAGHNFNYIDKGAVQFLYEPSISPRYSRQQFEKDFGDVLHHINAPQKIADYVSANNIPLHYPEYIHKNYFLLDSILVKWPSEIYIRLKGIYSKEDSIFLNKAISLLNTVSDKFQLSYTDKNAIFPVIDIFYTHNDETKGYVKQNGKVQTSNMMFPRRQLHEIIITDNREIVNQKTRNIVAFSSLYKSLGFNDFKINDDIIELDSLGNISFKPDYKEILALIYEPVFYSGLTIDKFDETIEILKTKGYNNE